MPNQCAPNCAHIFLETHFSAPIYGGSHTNFVFAHEHWILSYLYIRLPLVTGNKKTILIGYFYIILIFGYYRLAFAYKFNLIFLVTENLRNHLTEYLARWILIWNVLHYATPKTNSNREYFLKLECMYV